VFGGDAIRRTSPHGSDLDGPRCIGRAARDRDDGPRAALARSSSGGAKGGLLEASVRENVRRTVQRLRNAEPSLSEPQRAGKLKVVGARYDLDTGEVTFLAD
jgi:hypothetical protein